MLHIFNRVVSHLLLLLLRRTVNGQTTSDRPANKITFGICRWDSSIVGDCTLDNFSGESFRTFEDLPASLLPWISSLRRRAGGIKFLPFRSCRVFRCLVGKNCCDYITAFLKGTFEFRWIFIVSANIPWPPNRIFLFRALAPLRTVVYVYVWT